MTDREKLVELLYENNVRCDQKIESLADDIIDLIANCVTAESEPVRHEKWDKKTTWIGTIGMNYMVCSGCGKRYEFHAEYHYCPNCGAKMDLED